MRCLQEQGSLTLSHRKVKTQLSSCGCVAQGLSLVGRLLIKEIIRLAVGVHCHLLLIAANRIDVQGILLQPSVMPAINSALP